MQIGKRKKDYGFVQILKEHLRKQNPKLVVFGLHNKMWRFYQLMINLKKK